MFVKISKADVLQSLGFAVTAAEEEHARLREVIANTLKADVDDGIELKCDMLSALIEARDHVERIKSIQRMAEFEVGDSVLLDRKTFLLLEPNLPAR